MTVQEPEISIIVPIYNEASNIETLMTEIVTAMESYGRGYEIVAIDDGSSDDSYALLKAQHEEIPCLRVIHLLRNFGQHPATYAGFMHARGQIIVTIDADLQNPPSDIPTVIDKLEEGFDVVQGWRQNRRDNAFRKLASRSVNRLVSYLTGMKIRDIGCALKAFRREAIELLLSSKHKSRYIPAETAWLGLKLAEVPVGHRERTGGESKYGLLALLRVNFDMIASVSTLPIRAIGPVGLLFAFLGFAMSIRVGYVRIVDGDLDRIGSVVAIFFFLAGVQMISTAVMCQYISRIYTEVQRRPCFGVQHIIESDD